MVKRRLFVNRQREAVQRGSIVSHRVKLEGDLHFGGRDQHRAVIAIEAELAFGQGC